jgi:hypothetical protein
VTWQERSACLQADPELFTGDHLTQHQVTQAKAFCTRCPVRIECLDFALTQQRSTDLGGIYGGLSPSERRAHRRHKHGCQCHTAVPMPEPERERWRPVTGWKGLYQVSDRGRVRSLDRRVSTGTGTRLHRGRLLTPVTMRSGYQRVVLCNGSLQVVLPVGRLVLFAFRGPPKPGQVCVYGEGGRGDNSLGNLHWGVPPTRGRQRGRGRRRNAGAGR